MMTRDVPWRSPRRLLVAVLLLALLVSACGGDDDDDDAADDGESSGAGATADSASSPAAAGLPTLAPLDGFNVVLSDTFDDPGASTFGPEKAKVVSGDVELVGGIASVSGIEDAWTFIHASSAISMPGGSVDTAVTLPQDGVAGVASRLRGQSGGRWSFYACWIAADGRAGCSKFIRNERTELLAVEPGLVTLADVNTLRLIAAGGKLRFEVNGQLVGTAEDAELASGFWGLYAEPADEPYGFDYILVSRAPAGYEVPD